MVSSFNIVCIILICKHMLQVKSAKQNCTIELKSNIKDCLANYNLTTMQQLHQLFTTTDSTRREVHNAKGLYMLIIPALPKISATLERLSRVCTKFLHHDQAFTAYALSRSLDPIVLIRSYCTTIKLGNHSRHNLTSIIIRSKAKKVGIIYAAYKKRTLLNKLSTITHTPCYAHLRSTYGMSILN